MKDTIAYYLDSGQHFIVPDCPYCHQRHYHGRVEGHRVAHCDPSVPGRDGGYELRPMPIRGVKATQSSHAVSEKAEPT
jgi:hypothetical protein